MLTSQEYDLFATASDQEARAWSHYFQKNFGEAALHFKRLIQQEQVKPVWLVALAQCQFEEYDYKDALLTINKALEFDKTDTILQTKGNILAEDGIQHKDRRKIIEASKLFEALYKRDPSDTNAYNWANTLSRLDRQPEAIALYQHALDRNPNNAQAWKNLGQVYSDFKEYEKEMDCYDKALRIDPELLQARVCRAVTLGRIYHQYDEAITTILECIERSPIVTKEYPNVYYSLGLFLARVARKGEAIRWLTKGLDFDPGNRYLLSLKGQILHELASTGEKKWAKEAIAFFETNYAIDPKEHVLFYYWCSAVESSGETERALEMANGWLQQHLFADPSLGGTSIVTQLEEALLIIKNYEVVRTYLLAHPVRDVRWALRSLPMGDPDSMTKAFDGKRIVFLGALADKIRPRTEHITAEMISALFRASFLQLDVPMVEPGSTKEKKEDLEFNVHVALTVVVKWCIDEAWRCSEHAVHIVRTGRKHRIDPGRARGYIFGRVVSLLPLLRRRTGLPEEDGRS